VISHGAGAVGNMTIGSSAMGGMIFGTIFGVVIIPGLYYLFGTLAEGRSMIKDEHNDPWSEEYVQSVVERDIVWSEKHHDNLDKEEESTNKEA